MSQQSLQARKLALAGALALAGLASASTAQAAEKTIELSCEYPVVGTQPVSAKVETFFPPTWQVGQRSGPAPLAITFKLFPSPTTLPFRTVEGEVVPTTTLTLPGGDAVLTTPLILGRSLANETGDGSIGLIAAGEIPSITPGESGSAAFNLEGLTMNLLGRDAEGTAVRVPPSPNDSDGDPDTFDVDCTVVPGQDTTYGTVTILDPVVGDVTPPTVPPAVSPGVTEVTPSSVVLHWGASTDEASGVRHYVVRWGEKQQFTVSGGLTKAKVTGLTPATDYHFDVSAVDHTGNESAPLRVFASTAADTTPPSPFVLDVHPGLNRIDLSWSKARDDVGVARYEIALDHKLVDTVAGDATSASITGLTEQTSYLVSVFAVDAAGNRTEVGVITRTGPWGPKPTNYGYDAAGHATLKTLTKGTLPLKGGLNATVTPLSPGFSADLTLEPAQGRLVTGGFLPITVKVKFVASGKTTGTLEGSVLTTSSKVRIKVTEAKLFGAIPLAGGNNCQTKQLSDINLKSTDFKLATGGTLSGTFAISDLNGCGALNGLVSPLVAGGGNTINLVLGRTA